MKRIMLVDDDFLSHNEFYTIADWARYGLKISCEAHGGYEALNYLEQAEELPDVAFIDVCMPDMDGITLLKIIRQKYENILCVMLSSYSDYPYVREALKLGAADYLLKHEMNREGILQLLSQNGISVDVRPEENEGLPFERVLEGRTEVPLRGYLLYAAYQGERPLFAAQQNGIFQTCRHILSALPDVMLCSPATEEVVMLFVTPDGRTCAKREAAAKRYAALLAKALKKYHNADYDFTPPRFCRDSVSIFNTYRLWSQKQELVKPRSFLASREGAMLTMAAVNRQKNVITQMIENLLANAGSEKTAKELINNLSALLSHIRQIFGLPAEAGIDMPHTLEEVRAYFIPQFLSLCDSNHLNAERNYSPGILDAIDYLNTHYAEDIHLRDVADYCHLSYSHLSYLFKKETGDNIISYLNRTRVYHAANLLLFDNLSITEAFQKSGFNGYNHFVSAFKAATGMPPSEFRKSPAAVMWLLNYHALPAKSNDGYL